MTKKKKKKDLQVWIKINEKITFHWRVAIANICITATRQKQIGAIPSRLFYILPKSLSYLLRKFHCVSIDTFLLWQFVSSVLWNVREYLWMILDEVERRENLSSIWIWYDNNKNPDTHPKSINKKEAIPEKKLFVLLVVISRVASFRLS